MFSKVIKRNSQSSRKDNSIFFTSLVVAVVAFYIILSLENQDVMRFLKTMESDAVERLTGLIPVFYVFSLFLIFFLVYFAGTYQMEKRSHEFGIYMMLGMKKSRLFLMLAGEDVLNSILALGIGLPAAVFLSELISLVTAKAVGLGIIGHRFTFSLKAAILTGIGFLSIKLLAFLILSWKTAGKEICSLMRDSQEEKQKIVSKKRQIIEFLAGVFLLAAAYAPALQGMAWKNIVNMGITVLTGTAGTFLLFKGLGKFAETFFRNRRKRGVSTFTFRQLQENVFLRWKVMAVSSLLILMALVCFGFGCVVCQARAGQGDTGHAVDFTFDGETEDIEKKLSDSALKPYVAEMFEVKAALLFSEKNADLEEGIKVHDFQSQELLDAANGLNNVEGRDILVNRVKYLSSPYLISLSGYNKILELKGKEPIKLGEHEAALYSDADMTPERFKSAAQEILKSSPQITIDGQKYSVAEKLYSDNFVADRAISIDLGLIVNDSTFGELFEEDEYSYWNVVMPEKLVKRKGMMQASMEAGKAFDKTGLSYESYLQTMGRQMFYVVASTYVSLYLALIFLIIANTVLAVQFLIQQQKTKDRYLTLLLLGGSYKELCRSARTQIKWYFNMSVIVAAISSIFGITSLVWEMKPEGLKQRSPEILVITVLAVGLLCIIEYIYMRVVMKKSDKYLLELINRQEEQRS